MAVEIEGNTVRLLNRRAADRIARRDECGDRAARTIDPRDRGKHAHRDEEITVVAEGHARRSG